MEGDETLFGLSMEERADYFQEYATTGSLPRGFYQRMGGDWLLLRSLSLVGRHHAPPGGESSWLDPAGCIEVVCASLVGITPGRVLLWPERSRTAAHLEKPFLGFLVRSTTDHIAFELRPLNLFPYVVTLELRTTDRHGPWENLFRGLGAPAWMSYQFGSGHGESYGRLLFTPERWVEMVCWLDYWLPRGVDST